MLTITAVVNTFTGFGQHFHEMFAGLMRRGVDCWVKPIEVNGKEGISDAVKDRFVNEVKGDWELCLAASDRLHIPTPGKKSLYFTMEETTRLGPKQVAVFNRANMVLVPSHWGKKCFEESGVKAPIRVVPLGINPEIFHYMPMQMTGPCVFGTAGALVTPKARERKNLGIVPRAFKKAFPGVDDVRLRIKGDSDPSERDPRINYTRRELYWHEIRAWYRDLTCYVNGSRGEGWGLMPHQAMAMGRPVITAAWGGVTEYFIKEAGYPVYAPLVPIPKDTPLSLGYWCDPDEDEIVEQMRRVYWDREEAKHKGKLSNFRANMFTWDRHHEELVKILKEVGAI